MKKTIMPVLVGVVIILAIQGCSRKTHPGPSIEATEIKPDTVQLVKRIDSVVVRKAVVKRKPIASVPRVIVVNDKFAKKSVDGRSYYDLQGHRYWRSNKDGKYYLFNKSMLTDAEFKKRN